ncbi:uncharacterized protein LOC116257340 isoform X2 [Nymphaea colorata]|uniref:uncharacterized protein LOC116257340 isoform X2 n=1 Tax=Nymphaea colorata TaxID=210225 RepID=UPI00129DA00B|nr:uncharacterized protein LOC116257340 isoform X2 [Nymphaea colorata]
MGREITEKTQTPLEKRPSILMVGSSNAGKQTLSQMSSFVALQDWVSVNSLQNFEILLCVGNRADLVPNHFAFTEYRRRLQKQGECSSDPHLEFLDYGILDNEGCSLLSGDEVEADAPEIRKLYMDWCREHNIEYVEACAANADFDKSMLYFRCLHKVLAYHVMMEIKSSWHGKTQ